MAAGDDYPVVAGQDGIKLKTEKMVADRLYHCIYDGKVFLFYKDGQPWPLEAWPDVPTRFLLCRDDRLFPADWLLGVVEDRLGIAPDEIGGGHCVALSRPKELAARLLTYLSEREANRRAPRKHQSTNVRW